MTEEEQAAADAAAAAKEEADKKAAEQKAAEEAAKKPPWGSDEEFDPDRAWKLVQGVRSDAEKAKAEREEIKAEREELRKKLKEHEDAKLSDQEKLTKRAAEAEQDATVSKQELARLRVALKMGLTETQAKRLVGDDQEALEEDAEELLASFKQEEENKEADQESTRRLPKERLRPGAAPGAQPEDNDPASLAKKVPRGW